MSSLRCRSGHTWEAIPLVAPEESKCPMCGDTVHVLEDNPAATLPTAGALWSRFPTGSGQGQSVENHPHAPPVGEEAPPLHLGGYRIRKVLGQGGMGRVLLAEDPQLQRQVAIKVMRPEFALDPGARQRFLREARAAAALRHDHIIPIYHVGEEDGIPFIVMPLLEGQGLHDFLKDKSRLPLADVLRIGREMAEGLAAAHAANLIHRDIKPANVWLERRRGSGGGGIPILPDFPGQDQHPTPTKPPISTLKEAPYRTVLLDFGLARTLEPGDDLTGLGAVMGTPRYMSPEQAAGLPCAAATDLYSLGCVLYQLAVGDVPARPASTTEANSATPPPHQRRPEVPPPLSDLILALLRPSPRGRPAAALVAEALGKIETGLSTSELVEEKTVPQVLPSPPAPRNRKRPLGRVSLALGVLGLSALGVYLLWSPTEQPVLPTSGPLPKKEAPPLPAPLTDLLDVRVWEKKNPLRQNLRLHQSGALPLKPGDLLRIEATVNRPAYLYLIWLSSDSKATPLYPWAKYDWKKRPATEEPLTRLVLPADAETGGLEGAPLDPGPSGIETLLLLVRETPLPLDVDLSPMFIGLPVQEGPPRLYTAAWFRNGELVKDEEDRAPQLHLAEAIQDPVMQTQGLLRGPLAAHFSLTRAVCFSFKGK